MISTFIQTVAVIIILAVMVMILLGIGHLFSGDFHAHEEDARSLQEDVDNRHDVITDRSLFAGLVPQRSDSGRDYVEKHENNLEN